MILDDIFDGICGCNIFYYQNFHDLNNIIDLINLEYNDSIFCISKKINYINNNFIIIENENDIIQLCENNTTVIYIGDGLSYKNYYTKYLKNNKNKKYFYFIRNVRMINSTGIEHYIECINVINFFDNNMKYIMKLGQLYDGKINNVVKEIRNKKLQKF
jgi:hypothetical protein